MKKAKFLSLLLTAVLATLVTLPSIAQGQGIPRTAHASTTGIQRLVSQAVPGSTFVNLPGEVRQAMTCVYAKPEAEEISAQFVLIRKQGTVRQGEIFEAEIYVRNTGNTPWFSVDSGCAGPHVSLGTDKTRDRESPFYYHNPQEDTGWAAPNRIKMTTKRVNPGELAEFIYTGKAPLEDGYFREVYTPVVEGLQWIDEASFKTDFRVGDAPVPHDPENILQYVHSSGNLTTMNIDGEKWIHVDISEQKMKLYVGDHVIREFPVSTGTYSTPTPLGTTHIFQKQQVRVGSSWPHYIMPKWMHFRAGGYGIHALPSLGNDGGVFWTEALNHIGTRRSHGCIRLLPQDAEFAYDFAPIGTKVVVVN